MLIYILLNSLKEERLYQINSKTIKAINFLMVS